MTVSPKTVGLTMPNTHTHTRTHTCSKVFTAPQCGVTLRIMTALPHTRVYTAHLNKKYKRAAKVRIHGHTQTEEEIKPPTQQKSLMGSFIGLYGRCTGAGVQCYDR